MTDIFGNNKPNFTSHFIKRYAERMFHVKERYADSWIKTNYNKFYTDLFSRLNKAEVINITNTKYFYIVNKYGKDVRFLKSGNFIFIIRNFKDIVTFIREEEI